jgi:hypothetical protein
MNDTDILVLFLISICCFIGIPIVAFCVCCNGSKTKYEILPSNNYIQA